MEARYLITCKTHPPFQTRYYDFDHFNADIEMIVYDLFEGKYTTDGKNWIEIEIDHL